MSTLVFSDLKIRGLGLDVVVIAPECFGYWTQEKFIGVGSFESTVDDVVNLNNLRHVAMLSCSGAGGDYKQTQGEPGSFTPCGGQLNFLPLPQGDHWLASKEVSHMAGIDGYLACTGCGMELITPRYTKEQLKSALFFLMLKQMVPLLPTCNFVDCSILPERHYRNAEDAALIRSLGVVAIDQCLWGALRWLSDLGTTDHCGLGFTLLKDMQTNTKGPGVMGTWLQYLNCRWHQLIEEVDAQAKPQRLGPRSVREVE